MTPTQVRKYGTSRTWTIETPLGRSDVFESVGRWDGPTLVVVGGHHGDEPAGYIAAGLLAQHAVADAGRLIIIPQANPQAIAVFSRYGRTSGEGGGWMDAHGEGRRGEEDTVDGIHARTVA